jgi:hypothetical protein
MRKTSIVVLACAALAMTWQPAWANCGSSTPFGHQLGSFLVCDDSQPLTAYVYALANPSVINSSSVKISCEEFGVGNCAQPASGRIGDTFATIEGDWVDPGFLGGLSNCANPGQHRLIFVVQAPDGKGAIASITGAAPFGVPYTLEAAHPFLQGDPLATGDGVDPIRCSDENGRPKLVGFSKSNGMVTLQLHFDRPRIFHDCEETSVGIQVGACTDAFSPTASVQTIYTSTQLCSSRPSLALTSWTRASVSPDADGDATLTVAEPPTDSCVFVGGTTNINGTDSGAITGWLAVGGPNLANPTAEGVMAQAAKDKVRVTFSTSTEIGLAGFDIEAVTPRGRVKVNDQMIAAKGVPSQYSVDVTREKLRGAKSLYVVSILTDGRRLDSQPANIQN